MFKRAGVFHADHNSSQHPLEETRRGEEVAWANLAQIRLHCFGAFGARNAETRPEALPDREDEIANPCHWQIGQHTVASVQMVELR